MYWHIVKPLKNKEGNEWIEDNDERLNVGLSNRFFLSDFLEYLRLWNLKVVLKKTLGNWEYIFTVL